MKKLILAIAAGLLCASTSAQSAGTGAYSHATFDNRGFDSINVGNLNVRFAIPIVGKAGRGLPFNYTLEYEGLVWSPSNGTWANDPNWGFLGKLNGTSFSGYLTNTANPVACNVGGGHTTTVYGSSNWVYHDPFGTAHTFNYAQNVNCGNGSGQGIGVTPTGDGTAFDGSGYKLSGSSVLTKTGAVITPGSSSTGSDATGLTDANGNQISKSASGVFTDTTGKTALTIAGSNPVTFTYPVVEQANSATTAAASLTYRQYSVRTNFGCGTVGDVGKSTPLTVQLVDHVTLADGSVYSFGYETTYGYSDGSVTGRLASITLPGGGTIAYGYSGGANSINCADGTPLGLTRTTADGPRPYWRAFNVGGNAKETTTSIGDNAGNQSIYYFSIDSLGRYEATHQQIYAGVVGQSTPLQEVVTCYNGSAGSCDGQTISQPITEVDSTTTFNGVAPALTKSTYDSSGNLTQVQQAVGNSSQYTNTVNSFAVNASAVTQLMSTKTTDTSGNVIAYTGYGYDESTPTPTQSYNYLQHGAPLAKPGNQTSVHVSIDGSTTNTLNTSIGYYDTGLPASTKDSGNFVTSYGYDSTGAFQTSTTLPTPSSGVALGTSASYDAASGAVLSATGYNAGQTYSSSQYDPLLRATKTTTPEGGQSTATYTPTLVSSKRQINSSQWADTETYLDGYGRTIRVAVQSSSGWYITDSCYDTTGRLKSQSTPYLSSTSNPSPSPCSASNLTQYTYDTLGRVKSISMPDGDTITKTYQGRAVQIANSNGQTRITQYDLLGRTAAVCEIVPANQTWDGGDTTQACGSSSPAVTFDLAGTGFTTAYAYDSGHHTTTVYQGAQTRQFITDTAGRTVQTVEPEAGTTTYSYAYGSSGLQNTSGLQVIRSRPRANQTSCCTPATTTTTKTQYDALGRITDVIYNDGTPNKNFSWDAPNHSNQGAVKGQITGLSTLASNGAAINARGIFYDIMGRVTEIDDCLPDWCGVTGDALQWYGYDYASEMTSQSYATGQGGAGVATVSYTYNVAGQLTNVSGGRNNAVNQPTIWSATTGSMQPGGPQFVTYGNNLTAYTQYDAMNRTAGKWLCGQPGGYNCPNSTYYYGYYANQVGDQVKSETDTVVGDSTNFYYDPVGNLSTSSTWGSNNNGIGFTAGYDRYGNRTYENVNHTPSGTGPNQGFAMNTAKNQIQAYVYDAVGNLMNDTVHTYQYDAENNLISIDNGATASFTFDALNQRDKVVTSAGVDRMAYDVMGRRFTTWQDGNAAVKEEQYYIGRRPLAFFATADSQIHFEHQNWIGTERMRTSVNGTTLSTFASLPFGEPNTSTGSDLDPIHFAELDQDGASGLQLHHATFREYNSLIGRWMSTDPLSSTYNHSDPQSMNRYTYARNNPLVYVDPDGTSVVGPCFQDCFGSTHGGSGSLGDYFQGALGSILSGSAPADQGSDQTPLYVTDTLDKVMADLAAAGFAGPNISLPTQPCLGQQLAAAIPGATLTGATSYQGGHEEFGITLSGSDLLMAGFTPYQSPFGANGYRSSASSAHVNGDGSNLATVAYGDPGTPVQIHYDVGNASLGVSGLAKHTAIDVVVGSLLGWIPEFANFLDPKCSN